MDGCGWVAGEIRNKAISASNLVGVEVEVEAELGKKIVLSSSASAISYPPHPFTHPSTYMIKKVFIYNSFLNLDCI